jgi:prephenate dehydrogenase
VGHDRDPEAAKRAKAQRAVQRWEGDLPSAVEGADLVILAVPFNETREVLSRIAPHLKADAVVFDTSPLKAVVSSWAKELLPPDRHWVGGFLIPGHAGEEVRADLYQDGLVVVVAPPGADSGGLELATRLAALLGAAPFFFDASEFDGVMAGVESLPSLLALACYRAVAGSPGWRDASLLAASTFDRATSPLEGQGAQALAAEMVANRENLLRRLDLAVVEIQELRGVLTDADAEGRLTGYLREAQEGRARWLRERERPALRQTTPAPSLPSGTGIFRQLLVPGEWFRPRKTSSGEPRKPRAS